MLSSRSYCLLRWYTSKIGMFLSENLSVSEYEAGMKPLKGWICKPKARICNVDTFEPITFISITYDWAIFIGWPAF